MKHLMILIIVLSAQFAFAGVLEKKAVKAGEEEIAEKVVKFKQACGTAVTVKSNHAMAEKMVMDGRTPDNMISVAGGLCAGYVSTLADMCGDADYKEEIAKLKTINCTPSAKMTKSPYIAVKKDGATLSIEHNPTTTAGSTTYDVIKAAF